jgi:predicted metal-dependent hydrolase
MQQLALEFPEFPFSYEVVRSRRKTLVIYVKSGKVEVRAPLKASIKWITSFLTEKTPWIQSQLAEQRRKKQQRLVIGEGSRIELLGSTFTLQVAISGRPRAVQQGSTLTLFVKEAKKEKLEKLFFDWLLEQAKHYMPAMARRYARQLGLDHKLKEVTFRKTKSKWGHCCQDGDIQFNWLVMLAPPPVLDYLIAHETSHLRYLNHSAKFWNTVGQLCPNYKEHRDWLSDNGHRLWP